MNNVIQKKNKTITTTISNSRFAVCFEKTQQRRNTHQVIVLDSITSSAKSSLLISLSRFIVKDHTATHPEFDYISVQYKYSSCKLKQV